jgi:hypothetical protein
MRHGEFGEGWQQAKSRRGAWQAQQKSGALVRGALLQLEPGRLVTPAQMCVVCNPLRPLILQVAIIMLKREGVRCETFARGGPHCLCTPYFCDPFN